MPKKQKRIQNSKVLKKPCYSEVSSKEKLLIAMLNVMSKKGTDKVTIDEILKEAGLTKPVLYYHFKDKDDLTNELFKIGTERFKTMIEGLYSDKQGFEELVLGMIDSCYGAMDEFPGFASLYITSMVNGARKNNTSKFIAAMYKMDKQRHAAMMKLVADLEKRKQIAPGAGKKILGLAFVLTMGIMLSQSIGIKPPLTCSETKRLITFAMNNTCKPEKKKK